MVFASGNGIAMVLGLIGSLVQAKYVGPGEMGFFRSFGIIAGYLIFCHLGVFDGLQREIPLQFGRNRKDKAEEAAAACLIWIIIVSVACGGGFILLAVLAAIHGRWMQVFGWLSYMPFVISNFYGFYLSTTYRSGQQFATLSKINIFQAVAGTLALPLFPELGYYAACARLALMSITNLVLLHYWRPMKVRMCFDWQVFSKVIRVGLPLSLIGYIWTALWTSLEGSFALHWFGIESLGLFSMAAFVRATVIQLVQNINQVMNVKVYEQYGRSGKIEDCVRMLLKPLLIGFCATIPIVMAGWILLPWFVIHLIPKYAASVPMMKIILFSMPLTILNQPVTILWATGRISLCFTSVIVGFCSFVSLFFILNHYDASVANIVIASLTGQAITCVTAFFIIWRLLQEERRVKDLSSLAA